MLSATLHGAGRFTQHLLHAWLNNPGAYRLHNIGDEVLCLSQLVDLLKQHDKLDFSRAAPAEEAGKLALTDNEGKRHRLNYFTDWQQISGQDDLWLECSGRYSQADAALQFHRGQTRHVLVSATCPGADQTLVIGFNHTDYRPDARVISYGSCTVNAFIPLADQLRKGLPYSEARVEVIHNTPLHISAQHPAPRRQSCTLTTMAPQLLPWLQPDAFDVSYTLIPWQGPSLITFTFHLSQPTNLATVRSQLQALSQDRLQGLYHFPAQDPGLNNVINSRYNAEFPMELIQLTGNRLTLSGYFDNENSALRYHQLVNYIAGRQSTV